MLKNNIYVSQKVDQCSNQNDKASHLVVKNLAWNVKPFIDAETVKDVSVMHIKLYSDVKTVNRLQRSRKTTVT
jgi:hypothetical protein